MASKKKQSAIHLSRENRRIVFKIEQYLETRYINDIAKEELLADIIGMAEECQARGESFADAIGGDHEQFCRELIRNLPRQSVHERVLHVLHWFLLCSMLLLPGLYLIELLFARYSPAEVDGLLYTVRLSFPLKYYLLMFVLVVGWFFVRMYTYKPTKYVFGTYFAVFMLFFLFTDAVLAFMIGERLITINILLWIVITGVLLVLCDLTKRIFAMTVAYRRRKNDGSST